MSKRRAPAEQEAGPQRKKAHDRGRDSGSDEDDGEEKANENLSAYEVMAAQLDEEDRAWTEISRKPFLEQFDTEDVSFVQIKCGCYEIVSVFVFAGSRNG